MPQKTKTKNKKIISAWLQKAKDDLDFAEVAFRETDFYDHICYLSQQAIEKYLKTIIVMQKGSIGKRERRHDLLYLAKLCRDMVDLENFREELRILSEAYIVSRYPVGGYAKAIKEDAQYCLASAKKIIDFIINKVDFSIYFEK